MWRAALALPILAATLGGCSSGEPVVNADLNPKTQTVLHVQTAEFQPGQAIPVQNSALGGNAIPTVSWSAVPDSTKSVAIIVDDSDANGFTHWVVFGIPPTTVYLASSDLGAAIQGENSSGTVGYFGPKPPPGKVHHYHFHVYALDSMLPLQAGAKKEDVLKAMSGPVLAQGELVGTFRSG